MFSLHTMAPLMALNKLFKHVNTPILLHGLLSMGNLCMTYWYIRNVVIHHTDMNFDMMYFALKLILFSDDKTFSWQMSKSAT